jgi:putative transposase
MNTYKYYRFPPDIISYAVRSYYRSNLGRRDLQGPFAEHGVTVGYEIIRILCIKFGAIYSGRRELSLRVLLFTTCTIRAGT